MKMPLTKLEQFLLDARASPLRRYWAQRQRCCYDPSFLGHVQLHRRTCCCSARMQSIGPVEREALLPSVEQGPRDPGFTACCTDIAKLFGSVQDVQMESVYLVFEDHRQSSQVVS